MSKNAEALEKYRKAGITIPECVNIGCLRDRTIRHVEASWNISFHNMCSRCKRQHEQGKPFDDGIEKIRKDICDNSNGNVRAGPDREVIQPGWQCPIAFEKHASYQFILDHIDGDNTNSHPDNLQTLCRFCNAEKSMQAGDWGN